MLDTELETFGAWVRAARIQARLSQGQLADRLGVTNQYVSNIERDHYDTKRGAPARPSLRILTKLPRALELPRDAVFAAAGLYYGEEFVEGLVDTDPPPDPDPDPDVDGAAFTAFFEGLPPSLKRAEYERLRQVYLDHKAGRLTGEGEEKA